MTATPPLSVQAIIDQTPVSSTQRKALVLCCALAMVDGFDALIIGYVIPAISVEWSVTPASLTAVTVSGLIGTIVGSMVLAPVGDRLGRRPIILAGAACFSVFTLLCALANDSLTLSALRFLGGIGLGAVPATLIAYTTELAPRRIRATLTTLIGTGLAGGGFIAGLTAGFVIPRTGWEAVMVIGGLLPAVLIVIAIRWLPETPQFVAIRHGDRAAALQLAQIIPNSNLSPGEVAYSKAANRVRVPVGDLLKEGRAALTVVVWVLYFAGFMTVFFIYSWLPSVLSAAGMSQNVALLASALCTLGGMAGGVTLGFIMDRVARPFLAITFSYAIGAAAIVVTAVNSSTPSTLLFMSLFVVGFNTIGTVIGANSLTAPLYPDRMRSSGLGWAYGFGRIGSVVGPSIGGIMLGLQLTSESIFMLVSVPAAVCALAVATLGAIRK